MAWTAKLISKEKEDRYLDLVVEFSDGTRVVHERFRITGNIALSGFKNRLRGAVSRLEAGDQAGADIPLGDVDLTIVPPPPPPPPTPEEIAAQAEATWNLKFRKLRVAEELVLRGAISDTLPALVTLRAAVQDDFLPSYFANIDLG